jgi:hypothetical protein
MGVDPLPEQKWYRGFVRRTMSSRGGAADTNPGFGTGKEENWEIVGGELLVMRMSMSCDGATAACIDAKEDKLAFLGVDFVSVCDSSLLVVPEEKLDDVNPYSQES